MDKRNYFEASEDIRRHFIENAIIPEVPEVRKNETRNRIVKLARDYEGLDFHALMILGSAAVEGKLEEYASRLEEYYKRELIDFAPYERIYGNCPKKSRAENFLSQCYQDLGRDSPFNGI